MRDPTVVIQPEKEPVSIEQARAHLRIDHGDEDVWLLSAIRVAREDAESFTGRVLINQTLELRLDAWPVGEMISLPRPPLRSVVSVKYTDEAGVEATLSPAAYLVDTSSTPGRLRLRYGQAWPGVTLQEMAGLVVRYTAGYGDEAASVPAGIRQAMLMMVGHLYENRESTIVAGAPMVMPMGVERLLWPHRVF